MTRETHRPRVLLLALSFGAGHMRAAHAIAEAIAQHDADADVRIVDALAGSALLFRAIYVWPYWFMVRYAPSLWRRLFARRLRVRSRRTAPAWLFRFGCRRVFHEIERFAPHVIVAAEVAAREMATDAKRRGLTRAAILSVLTDYHAEPAWVDLSVDGYVVPSEEVADQLREWGAVADRIAICGVPTDVGFERDVDVAATRSRYGVDDDRAMVLLMGGGMGPSRIDRVARGLCASGAEMNVIAVTGRDWRARRRLERVHAHPAARLVVTGWIEDAAALMRSASVLVTKPGGLTSAEAALCAVPSVFIDAIPGPEQHNAARVARAGAGIEAASVDDAVSRVLSLLQDQGRRVEMSRRARTLARPHAAADIASLVRRACENHERQDRAPIVFLTIANGAGHTRVAQAIASSLRSIDPRAATTLIEVSEHMTFAMRLTHVTIYLWLVRHAPWLWARIDRYQKQQAQTSPEWYYRRGCRRLFRLIRDLNPAMLVATEVGCCEIAALITRDLRLTCPLLAVNGEYDADRAWVQPEVTLYSVPDERTLDELCDHGAERRRVRAWGVPVDGDFAAAPDRARPRAAVCARLHLSPDLPIVLVSGGSEALGDPVRIVRRLLDLKAVQPQIVVLAGRNERVRRRCAALTSEAARSRLRVLGWTSDVRELMDAADLMVSKLGHTFDEAVARALPLVSLPPPPGSEQVQVALLGEWGVGRAVHDIETMAIVVEQLLEQPAQIAAMRQAAMTRAHHDAAGQAARWISDAVGAEQRAATAESAVVSAPAPAVMGIPRERNA